MESNLLFRDHTPLGASPDDPQTTRQRFESLTGLRSLAIWIAYFHVGHMYDHDGFGTIPYLELGVARVDVFFVLSGFVLAHVYWAQRTRPFAFGDFMMARLARIYPLHVFALGVLIAYLLLGMSIGKADHITNYSITGLLGNLALLQSFGLPDVVYWNFPAPRSALNSRVILLSRSIF